MKKIIIITFVITGFLHQAFSLEINTINSKIKEVTVFLNGAQVTRVTKVTLSAGSQVLAFRGLPAAIDPQSVQAKGEGNFIILSVLHQVNYLAGERKTAEVNILQDSLLLLNDAIAYDNAMLTVSKNEEDLLLANRSIGSTEKGVLVAELKLAADFYRSRLTEIKKEQLRLNKEITVFTQKRDRINNQLNLLNASLNSPTSEVMITVSANENTTGTIRLTYTVTGAGWFPVYDVRATDVQSPVELNYNAKVYQNTGEDWENVTLKLSTANPQQRGEKPNLTPWYLDFEQPVYNSRMLYNEIQPSAVNKVAAAPTPEVTEGREEDKSAQTTANYTQVNENQTNLEFAIKIPYDIPSDNKQYTINIQQYTLPATYEYYCAPKLDRDAFLLARITGWEDYNLLSGEINLFFEGTYVGKSNLDVRSTSDTLDLSLGRDKGIIVTRVKMKDYTEQKTIGSNIRETRAWEITMRNNKKQSINLVVEDQFPVSMNKDIVIEPLEYSGGTLNKDTGIVKWKLALDPSAEKKLKLSFAVKYPKDKKVYID